MGLVDLTRARLEAQVPELAGRTAGAADLARLMAQGAYPQVTPFAHVVPGDVSAGPAEDLTGGHSQRLTRLVIVLLTVRSADATGARALETIEELVERIIAAIAGWAPEAGGWTFDLKRARLASAGQGGAFAYEFTFALDDLLRIAP